MASVKPAHGSVVLLRHHGGHQGAPVHAEGHGAEASHPRHRAPAPRLPRLWHFSAEYLRLLRPAEGPLPGHVELAADDDRGATCGAAGGVGVAVALRLHLPHGVTWRDVVVVGFISTIGFTMALFFATAAVGPGPTLSELKMGALLSVAGAVAAFASAAVLRTGKLAPRH